MMQIYQQKTHLAKVNTATVTLDNVWVIWTLSRTLEAATSPSND